MELKSFNRRVHLYVKDDGTQYLDKKVAALYEKLEELPEGVQEFEAVLKTIPASVTALGSDASLRYMYEQNRLQNSDDPADRARAINAQKEADGKLMPQTEAAYKSVASSIISWNITRDGQNVEITEKTLKELEPAWIFDYLREIYTEMNEMNMRLRRD